MKDTSNDFFGFAHSGPTPEDLEDNQEDLVDDNKESSEEEENDQPDPEDAKDSSTDSDVQDDTDEDNEFSFVPVINELAEAGVLIYDPEKQYEDSEEGFQEVVADTVAALRQQDLESIPEDYRSIMDHLKHGGTLQEWVKRMDPTDYANADLEDEKTQEILVREQFKVQGFSSAQVEKKIAKLKDQGLLDSEAEDAQEYLVEKQKNDRIAYEKELKEAQAMQIKQKQAFLDNRKTEIFNKEEIAGVKVPKEKKQELFDFLYTTDKNGLTPFHKLLQNPEKLAEVAFKELIGIGSETYQRKAEAKATSTMKKTLTNYTKRGGGAGSGKSVTTPVVTNLVPLQGMPWGIKQSI